MKNKYQCRQFNTQELIAQIGRMNVLAISGGRVHSIVDDEGETVEVQLPVGKGYRVSITLGFMDTWTVRREYVRKGVATVKGVQEDVYADEVGEVAYRASCFVNVPFGEDVKA
jgi:hypothetical protein